MIIDIEQRNNQSKSELFISYFNVNGNIDYITIPLKPKDLFNWAEADGAYNADGSGKVTWDNKPIKKINKTDKKYSWENSNREFFKLSKCV